MNFFQQLLENQRLGQLYPVLETQFKQTVELLHDSNNTIVALNNNISELKTKVEELEAINNILSIPLVPSDYKKIDILDYKNKYLNSFSQSPYKYPFTGGTDIDIKYSLRVNTDKMDIVTEYRDKIDEKYNPQSPLECVESVMKYFLFVKRPKYLSEKKDLWAPANEFLETWEDDCDATAIAMNVLTRELLIKKGFKEHSWRIMLFVNDNYLTGHAANIWLHDDGWYYTVESTIDLKGSYTYKWLNVPTYYDSFYKTYRGVATPEKSFTGGRSCLKSKL